VRWAIATALLVGRFASERRTIVNMQKIEEQMRDMLKLDAIAQLAFPDICTCRVHLVNDFVQVFAGKDLEDAVNKAHEWVKGNLYERP
jgi:hypothetical protein